MSETASQYDSVLGSVLSEAGMAHRYVPFWDIKHPGKVIIDPIDDHIITMRMQDRFLGLFPYSRHVEVARIESEPESSRPYSKGNFPRYDKTMIIRITDARGKEPLISIGQRISDELNADVDILRGY